MPQPQPNPPQEKTELSDEELVAYAAEYPDEIEGLEESELVRLDGLLKLEEQGPSGTRKASLQRFANLTAGRDLFRDVVNAASAATPQTPEAASVVKAVARDRLPLPIPDLLPSHQAEQADLIHELSGHVGAAPRGTTLLEIPEPGDNPAERAIWQMHQKQAGVQREGAQTTRDFFNEAVNRATDFGKEIGNLGPRLFEGTLHEDTLRDLTGGLLDIDHATGEQRVNAARAASSGTKEPPKTAAARIKDAYWTTALSLGRGANFLAEASRIGTPESVAMKGFVAELAKTLPASIAESVIQTVANPGEQLREHPGEFASNVLGIAGVGRAVAGKAAPKLMPVLKSAFTGLPISEEAALLGEKGIVATADEAAEAIVDLGKTNPGAVEQIGQAAANLDRTLEDTNELISTIGVGGKKAEELAERNRAIQDRLRAVRESVAEKQGAELDAVMAEIAPEAKALESAAAAAPFPAPLPSEAGRVSTEMLAGMGLTVLGAAVGAEAFADRDNPEGRVLSPFGTLLGGVMGFGFARFLTQPALREAVADFASLRKGKEPSLENVFREAILPMLPEEVSPGEASAFFTLAGTMGGAAVGAAAGGYTEGREFDPLGAAVGAAAGAVGINFGLTRAGTAFKYGWRPKRTYLRVFTEAGGLPAEAAESLNAMRSRLDGRVAEIRDVSEALQAFPVEHRAAIDEYLRGNTALTALPPETREPAFRARALYDEMTLDLIETGAVTGALKDTMTANLGSYVPRLYMQYEMADAHQMLEKITTWAREQRIPVSRLSDEAYLLKRKDLPEDIRKALGEIRSDPGYLLAKRGVIVSSDIEFRRMANELAATPAVRLPDGIAPTRVTDAEAIAWAKSKGIRAPKGPDEIAAIGDKILEERRGGLPSGKFWTAGDASYADWNGTVYRKLSDNPKLGPLRGQYVQEYLAEDLTTAVGLPESAAKAFLDSGTAVFKASKVTWNPASLARNLMSNFVLADMAGLSPANVPAYQRTLGEFVNGGDTYLEARRAGLFGGGFRDTEIRALLKGVKLEGDTAFDALFGWTGKAGEQTLGRMERFHAASESFFKLALYQHARGTMGMSAEDAVRFAKRWIFDYRQVPKWVQFTRKSVFGAPFITFSYKSLPRVLESALAVGDPKKAWRFWKYPLAIGAVNEYSYSKYGDKLDPTGQTQGPVGMLKRVAASGMGIGDPLQIRRWLPEYAGAQQLLLPVADRFGRNMTLDLTWIMPWGDLGEVGQGSLGKTLAKAGVPYPRWLEPGNPWMSMFVAGLSGGREVFTGKPIVPENSSRTDHWLGIGSYLGRTFLPQAGPGGYSFQKLAASFGGDYVTDPNVPTPPVAAASELGGLRTRAFDPQHAYRIAAAKHKKRVQGMIADLNSQIARGADPGWVAKKRQGILSAQREFEQKFNGIDSILPNEVFEEKLQQVREKRRMEAIPQDWVPK